MKKFFIYILLCTILNSCLDFGGEPEEPPIPVIEHNCSIEVDVRFCENFSCDISPINLVNKRVEIYRSRNDAVDKINLVAADSTNQNGWVKFYDYNCGIDYFVRVDLEEHGVYISDARFFNKNSLLEVTAIKNYSYNFDNWAQPLVRHISLDFMTVGQYSRYNYFETSGLTFDAAGHYVGSSLSASVSDQLAPNTYVVSEQLFNNNSIFIPSSPITDNQFYTESVWRIEEDTLFVSNLFPVNNIISIIWGITEEEGTTYTEYPIPLNSDFSNFLDMNEEFTIPEPAWETAGECSEFSYQDYLFENLIVELRDYTDQAGGGPLKCLIYNAKDGLVRNIRFSNDGEPFTSGFDLIIE